MLDSQIAKHRVRLADLLSFARRCIPYYQRYIPADIDELVSDGRQWQQLPTVSKRRIQTNWSSFLADPNAASDPAVEVFSTSGTTGTPLKVARPKHELIVQTKRLWAARARWDSNIMHWKLLNLYCYTESSHQRVLQLGSTQQIDLSSRALAGFTDLVDSYEPDWMFGPPSALYRLAQHYHQGQRNIPTLKLIEATGEQLYPHQRDLVEKVFGCPVVNHYGCREFWVLSYECPSRSMHAWTDDLLLEVVQDGRSVPPGEMGELVVTSLTNRVMPLIRYRLGDFVRMSPSECSCGDPRPILTPVGGRVRALIVTREKTIPSFLLSDVFSRFIFCHEQALLEYQVVQSDYDQLEIHVVPGKNFEKSVTVEELTKGIHHFLPGIHCEFIICPRITQMPSGKTQTFISHVDIDDPQCTLGY